MRRWFSLACVLAACGGAVGNGHGTVLPKTGNLVMVGQPFTVQTRWDQQCKKRACTEGEHRSSWHADSDGICYDDVADCGGLPYDVDVQCSGTSAADCPHDRKHVDGGHDGGVYNFDITPTQPGTLRVDVTLLHDGETIVEDTVWDVRSPDDVQAEPSVPADHPLVRLKFSLLRKVRWTSAGRVNGKPLQEGVADLAALFPDRRAGSGGAVEPGTYELTVDAGTFHRVIDVEAVSAGGGSAAGP